MFELNKLDYLKVAAFASRTGCDSVYPFSIIEEFQDGQVFVDSLTDINCVLFWHQSGFGYLSGKASPDFLEEVAALIKADNNPRRLALQINTDELDAYFSQISGIKRLEQYLFCFNKNHMCQETLTLPKGFELKEIDADLLMRLEGKIIPSFSWKSNEDFLEKGKGFCITYGNEIVSSAFTAAISHIEVDIGIETNKAFRGHGFAKIVAQKMVDYILQEGKLPIWECNTSNLASKAIAETVGFRVLKAHPLFIKVS